jgi:hypothetical protein
MKSILPLVAIVTALSGSSAQDAVTTLPESYKLQFENAWVRVVRVHYGPNARLPTHTHTQFASAYVYLNDAGPVIFRHGDGTMGVVTRPPTRAGGFRLYSAFEEVHAVENTTAAPSDFLRVEFKTQPVEPRTLRGRFFRLASPETHIENVQFDNAQVRITRILVGPKRGMDVRADAVPALLIALAAPAIAPGDHRWVPAGTTQTLQNPGTEPAEFLRFDLKTPPIK